MNDIKLKPCPFCNGEAVESTGSHGDGSIWNYVECLNCASMANSIEQWNTRYDERVANIIY